MLKNPDLAKNRTVYAEIWREQMLIRLRRKPLPEVIFAIGYPVQCVLIGYNEKGPRRAVLKIK
jgi:hypothetical protein